MRNTPNPFVKPRRPRQPERLAWAGITAQRELWRETRLLWRRRQKQMRRLAT